MKMKNIERKAAKGERFMKKSFFVSLRFCVFGAIFSCSVLAQKIAILTPEKNAGSESFAAALEKSISKNYRILDASLSETAFRSAQIENAFNLSTTEAKNVGAAIGCNYFLLVKYENLRRASLKKDEYYEAHSVVYLVSSRTGNLIFWNLKKFEADKPSESENKLFDSIQTTANEISNALQTAKNIEISQTAGKNIEEPPAENSPDAANFRPPLPYRRIKPEYTATANLYDIEATIDVLVDVSESGEILRTEIARWAGYGLDEAVIDAVRKMNWRPADRNGKTLPMRILLRYNFKNIEDEN